LVDLKNVDLLSKCVTPGKSEQLDLYSINDKGCEDELDSMWFDSKEEVCELFSRWLPTCAQVKEGKSDFMLSYRHATNDHFAKKLDDSLGWCEIDDGHVGKRRPHVWLDIHQDSFDATRDEEIGPVLMRAVLGTTVIVPIVSKEALQGITEMLNKEQNDWLLFEWWLALELLQQETSAAAATSRLTALPSRLNCRLKCIQTAIVPQPGQVRASRGWDFCKKTMTDFASEMPDEVSEVTYRSLCELWTQTFGKGCPVPERRGVRGICMDILTHCETDDGSNLVKKFAGHAKGANMPRSGSFATMCADLLESAFNSTKKGLGSATTMSQANAVLEKDTLVSAEDIVADPAAKRIKVDSATGDEAVQDGEYHQQEISTPEEQLSKRRKIDVKNTDGASGIDSSGRGGSGGGGAAAKPPTTLGNAERLAEMKREERLSRACAICDSDIAEYTLIWEDILRVEGTEVSILEKELDALSTRTPSFDPQQPTTLNGISDTTSTEYLLALNLAFEKIDGTLSSDVKRMVDSLKIAGLAFLAGPPKKDARCLEKAKLAYDYDYSKLRDLRRASIVCPDIATVRKVCAGLDADPSIELLRVKNRFRRDYNAKDKSAGYRDVQFNIKAIDLETGLELVWELQVHLAAVEKLKTEMQNSVDEEGRNGHGRYVAFRTVVERL